MVWTYCKRCCTTKRPKRKVTVKATLEGTIQGDERQDRKLDTDAVGDVWVCTECGCEMRFEEDEI